MSYTPTSWQAGDTITSARLNKMEQGIASSGGAFVVHADLIDAEESDDMEVTDATAGEVMSAFLSGVVIISYPAFEGYMVAGGALILDAYHYAEGAGSAPYVFNLTNGLTFYAESSSDYPSTVLSTPEST